MKSNKETIKKVWRYIKQYRILLIFSILFAGVSVALTLYIPILVGRAIDCIVGINNVDFAGVFKILVIIGLSLIHI